MVKIEKSKKIILNKLINANLGEVVSMKIFNQKNSFLTLFALAKNEEITAEVMCGDRCYFCFSGTGEIKIDTEDSLHLKKGEFIKISKDKAYSLRANEEFKIVEVGEKIGENKMQEKILKGLAYDEIINLESIVDYQVGKIVSKNIVVKKDLVITVMSFDKNEVLEAHKAPGDALVTILDGKGKFFIDKEEFLLKKGESIILPANIPHAVEALEKFKMILILIK